MSVTFEGYNEINSGGSKGGKRKTRKARPGEAMAMFGRYARRAPVA